MRALSPLLPLVLVLGISACSRTEPVPEPLRAVRTVVVASAPSQVPLEFAGEVRARTESRLGFRVPGKLVSRAADLGDAVKAGQVLARLDPQDLKLGSDAAQAALAAARANHAQALTDFQRFKELRDQGFISSAELERRDTALKAAKSSLDQAVAQARSQGNQAAYASLVADASGVITAVEAEPGQVVSAGTPVVRLAHDGPRDVVFYVPEDKSQVLRALAGTGVPLLVRLWGAEAAPLKASVREVAAAADAATRTYLVKADLGRAAVKLGQTATVSLDVGGAQTAIHVPLSSLFEREGKSHVWVLDEAAGAVQSRPVRVAGVDTVGAVVTAGIEPGQRIVVSGVHVLTEGQKVRLYQEAKPAEPGASAASH